MRDSNPRLPACKTGAFAAWRTTHIGADGGSRTHETRCRRSVPVLSASSACWSPWDDSNARHPRPKRSALAWLSYTEKTGASRGFRSPVPAVTRRYPAIERWKQRFTWRSLDLSTEPARLASPGVGRDTGARTLIGRLRAGCSPSELYPRIGTPILCRPGISRLSTARSRLLSYGSMVSGGLS